MFKKKENRKESFMENEGLPEVANNKINKKQVIIFMTLGVTFILFIFLISGKGKETASLTNEENETYTVHALPGSKSIKSSEVNENNSQNGAEARENREKQKQQEQQAMAAEMALMQQKKSELTQRLNAPLLVVNSQSSDTTHSGANKIVSSDPNTQFLNQASKEMPSTYSATKIGPLNYLVAQGTFIKANLEVNINSDLPGNLRAIVSQPVYSEDGSSILIPKGTRVIGEYKSGLSQGQSRIFVIFTRLIIPGGISIQLNSQGTDGLGDAGFSADYINRHFFQQFGRAILLSVISAGVSNIDVSSGSEYNASQQYRIDVFNALANQANQTLSQNTATPPTLIKYQGAEINIYVNHDLNFEEAMKQSQPSLNIF